MFAIKRIHERSSVVNIAAFVYFFMIFIILPFYCMKTIMSEHKLVILARLTLKLNNRVWWKWNLVGVT